jgi:ADP-ribose pyrophosphatase
VNRRWHHLKSRTGYENARLRVLEERVIQPDGVETTYTVLEEHQGAVVVVAVDDTDRVVFVRQHRYPIDDVTLELPAGEVSNSSESILQSRKELWEETGVSAEEFELLGQIAPWPARARRWCDVVVARRLDLTHLGSHGQEPNEAIESVSLVGSREILGLIRSGEIFDGPSLSALALFWSHSNASQ